MFNSKLALQNALTAVLVAANLLVLTLFVSGWPSSRSQAVSPRGGGKSILKEPAPPGEPVEVADPKIGGKAVSLGKAFEAKPDWLTGVTISLKNKWTTPITYVRLDIDFPETQATGAIMMHQLHLGRRPGAGARSKNDPLLIEPNATFEVPLAAEYPEIKKLIELRHPSVEDVDKIVVRLGEVMFDDGTLYSGGGFFRQEPDPSGEAKWVRVRDGRAPRAGN